MKLSNADDSLELLQSLSDLSAVMGVNGPDHYRNMTQVVLAVPDWSVMVWSNYDGRDLPDIKAQMHQALLAKMPKKVKGVRQAFKRGKITWSELERDEAYNQALAEVKQIIDQFFNQEGVKSDG